MSTSPEDRIVLLLSQWLAFHRTNDELRLGIEEAGVEGLRPEQAEAVCELIEELARAAPDERGDLEMHVRETLEAIALG